MEKRRNLQAYVGNIQQLAYVRPLVFADGRATGLSAWQVRNGPLEYTILSGKCLDISELSYKGINLSFLAKPGLMGRNHFDTHGQEALRSIMGGFLFTSGMENICAPCIDQGVEYPMHGRLRSTPAEHVGADACWDADEYQIVVKGEMREAELFGENLLLRRRIETIYGQSSFRIIDEVTNEAFRPEPLMLLYHFNIGYPLLSESCRLILPSLQVEPRDEISSRKAERCLTMESPQENEPDSVFGHDLATDAEGNTFAAVWNEALNLGLKISFNKKQLPMFFEWKSTAAGDYALGLEPANSSVLGRLEHQRRGDLHMIEPFATERYALEICIFDTQAALQLVEAESAALISTTKGEEP